MDDEDRPIVAGFSGAHSDAAGRLAGECLDRYSHEELALRIAQLEAEVARVTAHRDRSTAHRQAADALFGQKSR